MVLVDTSVWIDFFRARDSIHVKNLEKLIKNKNKVVICGIILQEILQGIKDTNSYNLTKERLSRLPFINTNKETYIYASSIYRTLRNKGITIPSVDVTIAAICIMNKIPLLTKDEHFKKIAKHFALSLYE